LLKISTNVRRPIDNEDDEGQQSTVAALAWRKDETN